MMRLWPKVLELLLLRVKKLAFHALCIIIGNNEDADYKKAVDDVADIVLISLNSMLQ